MVQWLNMTNPSSPPRSSRSVPTLLECTVGGSVKAQYQPVTPASMHRSGSNMFWTCMRVMVEGGRRGEAEQFNKHLLLVYHHILLSASPLLPLSFSVSLR